MANEPTSKTIRSLVESSEFKTAVASALPAHLTPERFVRIALTAMTRTPKLADCTKESVFQCLLLLSQFGLEPDGRNAHLIPFGTVCQLIIDYKGLVDLAMRSGKVATIHADKVCENDEFECNRGIVTKHIVNFKEDRGKAYAYYAMVRNKDGSEKYEVMTLPEVNAIRERSRAKNSGPWVTDFDEMAKKTVFRRLSKWIQLSPEYREALDHDMDAFEEWRFENAKPALKRPIIKRIEDNLPVPVPVEPKEGESRTSQGRRQHEGGEAREGTESIRDCKADASPKAQSDSRGGQTSTQKGKLERKKKSAIEERPNHADLLKRLSVGNFTEEQFIAVAKSNDWITDSEVTKLQQVPEEKIGQFLDDENFTIIMEELEKSK
jgi:recombination protein RecT